MAEDDAALIVQNNWRGHCARKKFKSMKAQKLGAITRIQRCYRGSIPRKQLRKEYGVSNVKLANRVRLARQKVARKPMMDESQIASS